MTICNHKALGRQLYVWPWHLINCKFRKSMVMHDTECLYWDQVSLNNTNPNSPPFDLNILYSEGKDWALLPFSYWAIVGRPGVTVLNICISTFPSLCWSHAFSCFTCFSHINSTNILVSLLSHLFQLLSNCRETRYKCVEHLYLYLPISLLISRFRLFCLLVSYQ